MTLLAVGPRAVFPPEVALHVVRLACERPDTLGRSLSQGDCHELARQLVAEGLVEAISAATVRRILAAHQLKPWRHHLWLHPKKPRDAAFYTIVSELIDLYTRPRGEDGLVLSVDEKTSLQSGPVPSPLGLPDPRRFPIDMSTSTSVQGRLICLRRLIPVLVGLWAVLWPQTPAGMHRLS